MKLTRDQIVCAIATLSWFAERCARENISISNVNPDLASVWLNHLLNTIDMAKVEHIDFELVQQLIEDIHDSRV